MIHFHHTPHSQGELEAAGVQPPISVKWFESPRLKDLLPASIGKYRPDSLGQNISTRHYLQPCGEKLLPLFASEQRELCTRDSLMFLEKFPDAAKTYLGAIGIALGQLMAQKRNSLNVLDLDYEVGLLPVLLNSLDIPHAYHAVCFSERATQELTQSLAKMPNRNYSIVDFHTDNLSMSEFTNILTSMRKDKTDLFDLVVINGVVHHLNNDSTKSKAMALWDCFLSPLAKTISLDGIMTLGDYQYEEPETPEDQHRVLEAQRWIEQYTGVPATPAESYLPANQLLSYAVAAGFYPFEVQWSDGYMVKINRNVSALMYHAAVFYLDNLPPNP